MLKNLMLAIIIGTHSLVSVADHSEGVELNPGQTEYLLTRPKSYQISCEISEPGTLSQKLCTCTYYNGPEEIYARKVTLTNFGQGNGNSFDAFPDNLIGLEACMKRISELPLCQIHRHFDFSDIPAVSLPLEDSNLIGISLLGGEYATLSLPHFVMRNYTCRRGPESIGISVSSECNCIKHNGKYLVRRKARFSKGFEWEIHLTAPVLPTIAECSAYISKFKDIGYCSK